MKKIKKCLIVCLVVLMIITSLPMNVLANNETNDEVGTLETMDSSQEEVLEEKEDAEEEVEEKEESVIQDEEGEEPEEKDIKIEILEENNENDEIKCEEKIKGETFEKNKENREEGDVDDKQVEENEKINSDEDKEDILKEDNQESLFERVLSNFNNEEGFLGNIKEIFLKHGEVAKECPVYIKIVDSKNNKKGVANAKVIIRDVTSGNDEDPIELETDNSGIININLKKGSYTIEQIEAPSEYLRFMDKIKFKIVSVEWGKLIKIENMLKDEKSFNYTFKAVDAMNKNKGIEGIKIRVIDEEDKSLWLEGVTDKYGKVTFNYLKGNESTVEYFRADNKYKVEIIDLNFEYSIEGINVDDLKFSFKNSENEYITDLEQVVEFKKSELKEFFIYNVINENGKEIPIPGSVFEIYDKNKKYLYKTSHTNENGETLGIRLPINQKYYIRQIKTNSHCILKGDFQKIHVDKDFGVLKFQNERTLSRNKEGNVNIAVDYSDVMEGCRFFFIKGSYRKYLEKDIQYYIDRNLIEEVVPKESSPYEDSKSKDPGVEGTVMNVEKKDQKLSTSRGEPIDYYVISVKKSGKDKSRIRKIYTQKTVRRFRDFSSAIIFHVNKSIEPEYEFVETDSEEGTWIPTNRFFTNIRLLGSRSKIYSVIAKDGITIHDGLQGESLYVNSNSIWSCIKYNGKIKPDFAKRTITNYLVQIKNIDLFYTGLLSAKHRSQYDVSYISELKPRAHSGIVDLTSNSYVEAKARTIGYLSATIPSFYLKYTSKYDEPEKELGIKVTKYETIDGKYTGKTLGNVEFTLFNRNETAIRDLQRTNANGVAEFINIKDGEYILKETEGLKGYKQSEIKYYIKIANGRVVEMETEKEDKPFSIRSEKRMRLRSSNVRINSDNPVIKLVREANLESYFKKGLKYKFGYPVLNQIHPQMPIQFKLDLEVKDDVKEGDYFVLKFGKNMRPGGLTHPYTPQSINVKETKLKFARAEYNPIKNETKYIITKDATRFIDKKLELKIDSLIPIGQYGGEGDEYRTKANEINAYSIKINAAKAGGEEVEVFQTREEKFYMDYLNTQEKLIDENSSAENNFYRTYFEGVYNYKKEGDFDATKVKTVSYINLTDKNYNSRLINRSDIVFRIANRMPGSYAGGESVFGNFRDIRVYRIPGYQKNKYMTRTFGDFEKNDREVLNKYRATSSDYSISSLDKFNSAIPGISDVDPVFLKELHFKNGAFGHDGNDGYIVICELDMNRDAEAAPVMYSDWFPVNSVMHGIYLSVVHETAGASGAGLNNISVDFTNEKINGKISFKKVDANDNEISLAGVKFQLYKKNKDGDYTEFRNDVISDKNGQFEFNDLPVGEYALKETEGIEGYKKVEGFIFKFKIVLKGGEYIAENEKGEEISNEQLIKNTKKGISLIIKKVCADQKIPLKDVQFTLSNMKDNENKNVSKRTDEAGLLTFENLEAGEYNLKESMPQPGYVSKEFKVIVTEEKVVYQEINNKSKADLENINIKSKNTFKKIKRKSRDVARGNDFAKYFKLVDVEVETSKEDDFIGEEQVRDIVLEPKLGEFITINMDLKIEKLIPEKEKFHIFIDSSLTPNGPVKAPPICIYDTSGKLIAKSSEVKSINGVINKYIFEAEHDLQPGMVKGVSKLFIDSSGRDNQWNSLIGKRLSISTSNEDIQHIYVDVDFGEYLGGNREMLKERSHCFIKKIGVRKYFNKLVNTYDFELFFIPKKGENIIEIDARAGVQRSGYVGNEYLTNSFYGVFKNIKTDELGLMYKGVINDINKTTTIKFNESNDEKIIGLQLNGEDKNEELRVKINGETHVIDIKKLLELREEAQKKYIIEAGENIGLGTIIASYIYIDENGKERVIDNEIIDTEAYVGRDYKVLASETFEKDGEIFELDDVTQKNISVLGGKNIVKFKYKKINKIERGYIRLNYIDKTTGERIMMKSIQGKPIVGSPYDLSDYIREELVTSEGYKLKPSKDITRIVTMDSKYLEVDLEYEPINGKVEINYLDVNGKILNKVEFNEFVDIGSKLSIKKEIEENLPEGYKIISEIPKEIEVLNSKEIVTVKCYSSEVEFGRVTISYIDEENEIVKLLVPISSVLINTEVNIGDEIRNNVPKGYTLISKIPEKVIVTESNNVVEVRCKKSEKPINPEPITPEINSPIVEIIVDNGEAVMVIENILNEKEFIKTGGRDSDGKLILLPGAKFALTRVGYETKKKISESDERGRIKYKGLIPGEYYLEEIKAPSGYILKRGVVARFKVENDGSILDLDEDKNVIVNGDDVVQIKNEKFKIPNTGVDTVVPFMGLGMIFIAVSGKIFFRKK